MPRKPIDFSAGLAESDFTGGLEIDSAPDPLANVEYEDNVERDSVKELDALQAGFRERAKAETDRFRLATDSEYWFAVCFKSREQKEAFLTAMQWIAGGDKYLDGIELARKAGIALPPADVRFPDKRPDKLLDSLPTIE